MNDPAACAGSDDDRFTKIQMPERGSLLPLLKFPKISVAQDFVWKAQASSAPYTHLAMVDNELSHKHSVPRLRRSF
jgi:hypothetical protein